MKTRQTLVMEKTLQLVLLLSGFCSPASCIIQPPFVLSNTPKTWYEAQSYCRETYADLATINDMEAMETVLKIVEGTNNNAVWIGLWKATTMSWHWSLAHRDFYKNGERNYLIWSTLNNYNCGAFRAGKLISDSCDYSYQAVCFDGTKTGRSQYVLTTQRMSWPVARDYCRAYYTDLTSLRNNAEYKTVQDVASGALVWTGLFRDRWKWSDETDSSLRYWNTGLQVWTPYDQNYGAMLKNDSGKWEELAITEEHPFLCSTRTLQKIIKVRIKSQDSTLNLNPPAAQDSILNDMRLAVSGSVTGTFCLSWRKQDDEGVFIKEPQRND